MTFTITNPSTGQREAVTVNTPAEGFAIAEKMGARILRDQLGEKLIRIAGEWYAV